MVSELSLFYDDTRYGIVRSMYPDSQPTPDSQESTYTTPNADLILKLRLNKQESFLFRRRRLPDWTDNYTLYRDKVVLNRLTQRQSVNVPLIKSAVKTLLKDVDDPPMLYFSNLDNNDQAEVFYNEYWKYNSGINDLVLKDVVDKRQVMLFGRSFKFMNIVDGNFKWEVVDPQDVLIDRYVDPTDIDSARYVIREHIYVPLSSLTTNPKYDNAAVRRLQKFLGEQAGLVKAEENPLDWVEKNRRFAAMGVVDVFMPILGETYIELNEFFIKEFNSKTNKDEVRYIVTAEDMEVIYNKPLEECIGKTSDDFWKTHYPITTWGDETERTDFWSDGVVDALRTLNKIMNAWFSQMVENRTYRNFSMKFYNSSLGEEGFNPQSFEPVPFGMYPIPVPDGMKIGDVFMDIPIPDLTDDLKEMEFIMTIAQQASAATTFQQGVQQEGTQITLGEVKLLLANAQERVKSMAVYYTASWEDFGLKYTKMLEAASHLIDPVVIHKKGRLTKKNYSKLITPEMWYTKSGHKVEVRMKEDIQAQTGDSLQKLQYSKSLMPNNQTLDTIIKKKSLDFADLNSSEIAEVMKTDEEQMKEIAQQQQQAQMGMGQPGMQPGMPPQPGQPQLNNPTLPQIVPQQPMQQPMAQ